MKENYKVYIHTFQNGKTYVGITKQEPMRRWKYGAGYKKNQPFVYNAIQKYGWQNIYHQVLYDGLSKDEAEKMEIELISILKSNNRNYGYNLANGGNCRGTLSEESRKKLSKSRKGIVFSEEHIKKNK